MDEDIIIRIKAMLEDGNVADSFDKLKQETEAYTKAISDDLNTLTEEQRKQFKGLERQINNTKVALYDLSRAVNREDQQGMEKATAQLKEYLNGVEEGKKKLDELKGAASKVADTLNTVEDVGDSFNKAIDGLDVDKLRDILELPKADRLTKYENLLNDLGVDLGKVKDILLPTGKSLRAFGDEVVKAAIKAASAGGKVNILTAAIKALKAAFTGPAGLVRAIAAVAVAIGTALLPVLKSLWERTHENQLEAKKLADAYKTSHLEVVRAVESLSQAWEKAGEDEKAREEAYEEGKKVLAEYGLAVNDIVEYENLLINNKDDLINALDAKARAMARMQIAEEHYSQALQYTMDAEKKRADRIAPIDAKIEQTDRLIAQREAEGRDVTAQENYRNELLQERQRILAEQYKDDRRAEEERQKAQKALKAGIEEDIEAQKELNSLTTGSPTTPTTDNDTKGKKDPLMGSIDWYNDKIAELKKTINSTTDDAVRLQAQATIKEYEADIERINEKLRGGMLRANETALGRVDSPNARAEMGGWQQSTTLGGFTFNGSVADQLRAQREMHAQNAQWRKEEAEANKTASINWKEQVEILNMTAESFDALGEAIGGVEGEIISFAGSLAKSAGSIVSSIQGIKEGTSTNSEGKNIITDWGSFLSGIGGIASGVVTAITKVINVINANAEANRKAQDAAQSYLSTLIEITNAQALEKTENAFGTDTYAQFKAYSEMANNALKAAKALKAENKTITSDMRSGWQQFWGADKNQSTTYLSGYYDENGMLNVEQLKAWYQEYAEGIEDEDKRLIETLISDWDAYYDAMDALSDYLTNLFGNTADSVADAMIDAFVKTGDAMADLSDIGQTVGKKIAKEIVVGMLMEGVFTDDAMNRIRESLLVGDAAGAITMYNRLLEQANAMAPQVTAFLQSLGLASEAAEEEEVDAEQSGRTAAAKGIAQASQDSVDENNARLTTIQIHTYEMNEGVKDLRLLNRELVANTSGILAHVMGIHTNTDELQRLRNMESRLDSVAATVLDIKDKGVRML